MPTLNWIGKDKVVNHHLDVPFRTMVKLPIVVYNRATQQEVIDNAIYLRATMEQRAKVLQASGGAYIRPIVLFQAQPKTGEDAATFRKLKAMLIDSGIPKEQIAIKTSEINELKGINLLSQDCPIRFIITVNALKEGWDCPFAYILATLANRTSRVDVEQIVGRVLRLPYTRKHNDPSLNMSYVLTSSGDFMSTVSCVVKGLNQAGFTDRDCRAVDTPPTSASRIYTAVHFPAGQDFPESSKPFVRILLPRQWCQYYGSHTNRMEFGEIPLIAQKPVVRFRQFGYNPC